MLPPERSDARPRPSPGTLPASSAATRRRARALDDQLRALEQEHDRMADLLVGDRDDVVEQVAQDRRGQRAGLLDRDALRDRVAVLGAAGERADRLRLDADEPHARPERAQRDRDAGREAAAADRDDERPELRQLLGELEPDRSLARDHALVLEGVHERRAGRLDVRVRRRERVVEGLADELDGRAVVPRRVDLRHRRVLRHEDRGRDARLARRPGDGLAVVAGARRDDAGRALLGARASRSC